MRTAAGANPALQSHLSAVPSRAGAADQRLPLDDRAWRAGRTRIRAPFASSQRRSVSNLPSCCVSRGTAH